MRGVALLSTVLVLAACGGGGGTAQHAAAPAPVSERPLPAKLRVDLRAISTEAAKVKHNSLLGTPALQQATGRFLDDLQLSKLTLLEQNRALDHAASAVAGSCDQCFQMIEANRPIPALAHPH
jgi:hypothetical protein